MCSSADSTRPRKDSEILTIGVDTLHSEMQREKGKRTPLHIRIGEGRGKKRWRREFINMAENLVRVGIESPQGL